MQRELPRKLRHGPALRRLILDGLIVLALAAAAELAIRQLAPRYLYHRTDAQYTGGFPLRINPDGSRGTPVPLEKPEGSFRVLSLGDSTTLGTGVGAESTFAAQLAPKLRALRGGAVETINGGVPGCAVKDLELALEERWADYRPDVVVLAVSGNCASWAWVRRDDAPHMPYTAPAPVTAGDDHAGAAERVREALKSLKRRASAARQELALANFLRINSERVLYKVGLLDHLVRPDLPLGSLLAYGWKQADVPPATRRGVLEAFDRELESFIAAADRLGIPVVVTVIPPSFTISELGIDNEKSVPMNRMGGDFADHVASVCAREGVPFADIGGALRAVRREDPGVHLYRQMDYSHLSPAGHQAAAAAIAGVITPAPP